MGLAHARVLHIKLDFRSEAEGINFRGTRNNIKKPEGDLYILPHTHPYLRTEKSRTSNHSLLRREGTHLTEISRSSYLAVSVSSRTDGTRGVIMGSDVAIPSNEGATAPQNLGGKKEWVEVFRAERDNIAVTVQCFTLPRGQKKYSTRIGYHKPGAPDDFISSFMEAKVDMVDGTFSTRTLKIAAALLIEADEFIQTRIVEEGKAWLESRRSYEENKYSDGHQNHRQTGKTERDREKKRKKG